MKAQTHQTHFLSNVTPAKCLASASAIAGLFVLMMPVAPALAIFGFGDKEVSRRDYGGCVSALTGLTITSEAAASACARSFNPEDLGVCVRRTAQTGDAITAEAALSACREVRRPVDLSTCVVDIQNGLSEAPALTVLDNCRRSLLPRRYANCVVGVTQVASVPPASALNTCIDASDNVRGIDPTFIQYPDPTNSTPQSIDPTLESAPTQPTVPPANPTTP